MRERVTQGDAAGDKLRAMQDARSPPTSIPRPSTVQRSPRAWPRALLNLVRGNVCRSPRCARRRCRVTASLVGRIETPLTASIPCRFQAQLYDDAMAGLGADRPRLDPALVAAASARTAVPPAVASPRAPFSRGSSVISQVSAADGSRINRAAVFTSILVAAIRASPTQSLGAMSEAYIAINAVDPELWPLESSQDKWRKTAQDCLNRPGADSPIVRDREGRYRVRGFGRGWVEAETSVQA